MLLSDDEPVVGASLKMYLGFAETLRYLRSLGDAARMITGAGVFVLPSFPALTEAKAILAGTGVAVGTQDGHWAESGPFTGSVSPAMLAEIGCGVVELGHHERRSAFGEDDAVIARKAIATQRNGMVPLVCTGEQRQDQDAAAIVAEQVAAVLDAADPELPVWFAYEPAWAIGGEAPAEPDRIAAACAVIRSLSAGRPGQVRVLYGGSVTADQVATVMCPGVDGVFVGRAALRVPELLKIVSEVEVAWQQR